MADKTRELAMFNLAIDSKLRASDLVKLKVSDLSQSGKVQSRAMIVQKKTGRPVQFEITKKTRQSLEAWISQASLCLRVSTVGRADNWLCSRRLRTPRKLAQISGRRNRHRSGRGHLTSLFPSFDELGS